MNVNKTLYENIEKKRREPQAFVRTLGVPSNKKTSSAIAAKE